MKADKFQSRREEKFVQAIANMKGLFGGVHGRIIDLCKTRRKEHNLAVTVAMGRNLDSIVVEKESTAHKCINYLKERELPPAEFLPLDKIQVKPIDDSLRAMGRGVRLIYDVLECEEHVKKAVQYAVGNCLLFSTVEEARRECLGKRRLKGVTLDGTVISRSGQMTGGVGTMEAKARRWEQRHLSELKQKRQDYQDELSRVDIAALRHQEEQLVRDIHAAEADKQSKKTALDDARKKLKNFDNELELIDRELHKIEPSLREKRDYIQNIEGKVTDIQGDIHTMEDEVFSELCKTLGVENIREYESGDLVKLQQQASEKNRLSLEVARLKNSIDLKRSNLDRVPREIEEEETLLLRELKEMEESVTRLDEDAANIEADIRSKKKDREELRQQKTSLEREAKGVKKELKAAQDARSKIDDRRSAKTAQIHRLQADRSAKLEECKIQQIQLPQKDSERIDYGRLPKHFKGVASEAQLAELRKELQDKMQGLQDELSKLNPNMKAGDLLQDAKTQLSDAAAEFEATRTEAAAAADEFQKVKTERTERFQKAFKHIASVIDGIYKELTREVSKRHEIYGGQAYLSCDNPVEPYLDGIKYETIPPGKKYMDMENLSGGEKSLAALALLFAIHSFKPSPFLVLDEVDAALDARNVEIATRYIVARRTNLQCLVISLKEHFYEKADALVGICRESAGGYSRTLTMDLTQFAR
mmetsp:Transcript_54962/g.129875  ORF Transcript_54962/g.129875 Transcript_54962/m.129875 type:complete len:704 (+) Transcript_54962:109-2220(+)